MNRRTFLSLTAGMTLSLSGCLTSQGSPPARTPSPTASGTPTSSSPESSPDTQTPTTRTQTNQPQPDTETGTPTVTIDSACTGDRQRLTHTYRITDGPVSGLSLSLSADAASLGDTITARLRNTSDSDQESGSKGHYDIQRQTAEGWHSIFWKPPMGYWDGDIEFIQPSEGFTWELPLSRDGLSGPTQGGPEYSVCAPLRPGTYRFVYFGLLTEQSDDGDSEPEDALARSFTVTE